MIIGDGTFVSLTGTFDQTDERIQHYVDNILEHITTTSIYPKENIPFLNVMTEPNCLEILDVLFDIILK